MEKRKLICPHCDQRMSYHDARSLLQHIGYGQSVIPWVCEYCGMDYVIATQLTVIVQK